jgi:hypothetical protein
VSDGETFVVTLSTGLEVEYRLLPREEYHAEIANAARFTDEEGIALAAGTLSALLSCIVRPQWTPDELVALPGEDFLMLCDLIGRPEPLSS